MVTRPDAVPDFLIRRSKEHPNDAAREAWAHEVDRALINPDNDERLFLRLSYFGGLDQAGIASKAGAPLVTVAQTIAQALVKLGRCLEFGTGLH